METSITGSEMIAHQITVNRSWAAERSRASSRASLDDAPSTSSELASALIANAS